jgi:hypothetical protein
MVSGTTFISKKIKEQGFLKKTSPKNIPSVSEIRDSEKIHPGYGSRG